MMVTLWTLIIIFFFYLQEIATDVEADPGLQEEAGIIHHVLTQMSRYQEDRQLNMGQKWKLPPNGQPISLFSGNTTNTRAIIRPDDDSKWTSITVSIFILWCN